MMQFFRRMYETYLYFKNYKHTKAQLELLSGLVQMLIDKLNQTQIEIAALRSALKEKYSMSFKSDEAMLDYLVDVFDRSAKADEIFERYSMTRAIEHQ